MARELGRVGRGGLRRVHWPLASLESSLFLLEQKCRGPDPERAGEPTLGLGGAVAAVYRLVRHA